MILPSLPSEEDDKDLEDRLKVIVGSLENLVRSLRAREVSLGPSYDADKILSYYRQSNHPLILNVGGLRFRYFLPPSLIQPIINAVVVTRIERSQAGFIPNSRFDKLESCSNSVVKFLRIFA